MKSFRLITKEKKLLDKQTKRILRDLDSLSSRIEVEYMQEVFALEDGEKSYKLSKPADPHSILVLSSSCGYLVEGRLKKGADVEFRERYNRLYFKEDLLLNEIVLKRGRKAIGAVKRSQRFCVKYSVKPDTKQ